MWHRGGSLCNLDDFGEHAARGRGAAASAAPGMRAQHETWHGDRPRLSVSQGAAPGYPAAVLVKSLSHSWDSQKSSLSLQNVHLDFQLSGSSARVHLCRDCPAALI